MKKIHYLNLVNFLAAFLLFQIELIISKILLPKFGGSYLVWGGCMVFFQFTLLLGYLFCHLAIQKWGIWRYRYFHIALLLAPLLFFPGRSLPDIHAHSGIPLFLDIFGQLFFSIGMVFFVLSTVSIISQNWLAASSLPEQENPYVLYGISNLGSFLGLATYPFFFEAYFDLGVQLNIWRLGYLLLVGLHLIILKSIGVSARAIKPEAAAGYISEEEKIRWFILAAAGAMMFLSVTNIITYVVAPIPLFWIIPLCIYLVSFALNFKPRPFCPAWIRNNLHVTIGLSALLFWLVQRRILPFAIEIIAYMVSLFIICMFCQNELAGGRPKQKGGLTLFYLVIATGGVFGSILVTWLIPLLSVVTPGLMIEYLLGLFVVSLALLLIGGNRKPSGPYHLRLILYALIVLSLWPRVFKGYNIFGLLLIVGVFKFIYSELRFSPRAFFLSLLSILLISPWLGSFWSPLKCIYSYRNYYGIYKLYLGADRVHLVNGTIVHGSQYYDPQRKMEPLGYYHPLTAVGRIMREDGFNFKRLGIIGLGAGGLAAYGKEGQVIDFFELDPEVLHIANFAFSYLEKCPAKINYFLGDARVSLNKITAPPYDILIVDAFSGDSIPIHLLTTEAISEYKKHITKEGMILFHLTNNYLNLTPVLFSNAHLLQAYAGASFSEKNSPDIENTLWLAMTWSPDTFKKLSSCLKWPQETSRQPAKYIRPWTDKYSNTLSIFKIRHVLNSLRRFQPFYW